MKRIAVITSILMLTLFLAIPIHGLCDSPKEGRDIHLKILSHYKKIDKFYREPFIHGGLTSNPLCCISLPMKDWASLPENKKQALADYVASLVNKVKSNPLKYAGVNKNAPVEPSVRENISKMSSASWGIMVGDISPDGRDIMSDRIVRSGK